MTIHEQIEALTDKERTALFRSFGYVKKREPAPKRSALGAPPKLSDKAKKRVASDWAEAVKQAEARRGDACAIAAARDEVEDAARRILKRQGLAA